MLVGYSHKTYFDGLILKVVSSRFLVLWNRFLKNISVGNLVMSMLWPFSYGVYLQYLPLKNVVPICMFFLLMLQIYLLDIYIFYTLMSAVYGFLLGARDRLGEVGVYFCLMWHCILFLLFSLLVNTANVLFISLYFLPMFIGFFLRYFLITSFN